MIQIGEKNISRKDKIEVKFFYEQTKNKFKLKLFTNKKGFTRGISEQNLHRPGLALAGFVDLFAYSRVQIFGNTEIKYLSQLPNSDVLETLKRIFKFEIPCIIYTDSNIPSKDIIRLANKYEVPIFGTSFSTTKLIYLASDFLDDQFAPRISIHGSLVDVYGVGMLFVGKSGIGKSEVALDLVERGHRMVADDVVIFTKKGEGILLGSGTQLVQHFMEIRGVGIIDVRSMFGIRAIRFQKRLEVVIELELWDDNSDYTRTGLDESSISIQDVELPYIKLPIVPGKNITVIAEVIALNYLLRHYNYDASKIFQKRLSERIRKKSTEINRIVDYFEHDFE